jgi:hypothetical protein
MSIFAAEPTGCDQFKKAQVLKPLEATASRVLVDVRAFCDLTD